MQDRPVCFQCDEVVEYDPVYEAPCGHPEHYSVVFHGLCLMAWREFKQHAEQVARRAQRWLNEHGTIEGFDPNKLED